MYLRALSAVAALTMTATVALAGQRGNPPWYPSLQAFEHYDSGRSHVFAEATFGGSFDGPNRVSLSPVRQGRVPVRLQHVLPQPQGRLHPGRQLRRRRELDRAVRREVRPDRP